MFLREYIVLGNASEAWRKVYNPPGLKSAQVMACKTLKKPHVKRRLEQIWERHMKKSDITIENILTKYEKAYNYAETEKNSAGMVNAASAQAKLVGLLRDRVETGAVGEFDENSMGSILEFLEKEVGPEAALAIAAAAGVKVEDFVEKSDPKEQDETALLGAEPPTDAVN